MGRLTRYNMGNTPAKMQYTQVDLPLDISSEAPEFSLHTFARSPAAGREPLPQKVVLRIHQDRAELWRKGYDENDDAPIERWAFCNIRNWGFNTDNVRFPNRPRGRIR